MCNLDNENLNKAQRLIEEAILLIEEEVIAARELAESLASAAQTLSNFTLRDH